MNTEGAKHIVSPVFGRQPGERRQIRLGWFEREQRSPRQYELEFGRRPGPVVSSIPASLRETAFLLEVSARLDPPAKHFSDLLHVALAYDIPLFTQDV